MTEHIKIEQLVVGMVATNCYIVMNTKQNEAFIVDPGADARNIRQKIAEMKCTPVAILLTHGHFDHAGAAEELAGEYDIPIYAHEKEQDTLENPMVNLSGMMAGDAKKYPADVYVRDGEELAVAGFTVRVLFTPGHTVGGCCYYIAREDVVFSGDSLFCGSIGRTDFPGGSAAALVQAVREKLLVLPGNTRVLPGHDARTTIEQERMYNPFL